MTPRPTAVPPVITTVRRMNSRREISWASSCSARRRTALFMALSSGDFRDGAASRVHATARARDRQGTTKRREAGSGELAGGPQRRGHADADRLQARAHAVGEQADLLEIGQQR